MAQSLTIPEHARRLRIYFGESDRWRGKPLYAAILEALKAQGIAGATVLRGVAGFGAHSRIHTASVLRLSEDLPLLIEVVDAPEKIALALEVITPMLREGLITLEDVSVIRYTHRYLNPLPADKPVNEVMTHQVITLRPDMTIAEAWEVMLANLIKAAPVVDSQQRVLGMLTDEDLMQRAGLWQHLSVAERLDAETLKEQLAALHHSTLKVADVMTQPAITAQSNESLGIAAARMAAHGIKRLPIVDQTGRLLGILSRVDVLRQVMAIESQPLKRRIEQGAVRTVDEIMYPEIPTIPLNADLSAIVAALLKCGVRRLVVVDAENRPLGLISDSDVVSRIQPRQRRGVLQALRGFGAIEDSQVTAEELMSPGVLTATEGTDLIQAAQQMLREHRKWLVVVNQDGKTIGLVDRQLLLRALTMG